MATLPNVQLDNPTTAQQQAAVAGGTATTGIPNQDPSSLQNTMTTQTPAVVTSTPARKQTNIDQQQLKQIQDRLNLIKQQADELAQQEAAAKIEADKTSMTDRAINDATGVSTGPQETPEQLELKRQMLDMAGQMKNLIPQMEADSGALIGQIESEYAGLIRQQEEINKAYEAGIRTEGFRSERARYAPLLQGQIIKAAIDSGLQKIADLNTKKQRLILEAKIAQREGKFKALNETMNQYRNIVKQEQEMAQQTYENKVKASQEARAQLKAQQEEEKFAWDYADTIAPSVVSEMENIKDPVQRVAYITNLANQIGIDPGILSGKIQEYSDQTSAKNSAAVKEYEYAVKEQGYKGSYLNFRQAIAAATRQPDTLSPYEAFSLGLPKTMWNMSAAAVSRDLNSPNIPQWFRDMKPGATQEDWNTFRMSVPSSGGESFSETLNKAAAIAAAKKAAEAAAAAAGD